MTAPPIDPRDRDRRYVWHPWSPIAADRAQLMMSRGDGYRVWDVDGKEYIDASSLNATCGYAHPLMVEAISRQLLRFHGLDISIASHDLAGQLGERLASYLPDTLSRTLFVNSGSEGVEAAALIAHGYWSHRGDPRSRIVGFTQGYHGSTVLARSASGLPRVEHPFEAPLRVTHIDLPLPPHQLRQPASLPVLLSVFERALDGGPDDKPMAVMVEPFINVGGGVVLPAGFLAGLRQLCDAADTLLILDEVFTGYGRTGRMFAFQHEDAAPDILISSKGLAGGYLPIAAVTAQQWIYDSFTREPVIGGLRYGHTTSGHAAACAAALATLDLLENDDLVGRAARLGATLLNQLKPLTDSPDVTDVRGIGLIAVVETSSPEVAAAIHSRAEEAGLLLRLLGGAVMAVPPMTISEEGVATIADRLRWAAAIHGR